MEKSGVLLLLQNKLKDTTTDTEIALDDSLTTLTSMGFFVKSVFVNAGDTIPLPSDFVEVVSVKNSYGQDLKFYVTDAIYITGVAESVYKELLASFDVYIDPITKTGTSYSGAFDSGKYLLTYKYSVSSNIPDKYVTKVLDYAEYLYFLRKASGILSDSEGYPNSITDSDGDMSTTISFVSSKDLSGEFNKLAELALNRFLAVDPYVVRG